MFFMAVVVGTGGSELSNTLRGPLAPLQEAELLSALRTATEICEPLQGAASRLPKHPSFHLSFHSKSSYFGPFPATKAHLKLEKS